MLTATSTHLWLRENIVVSETKRSEDGWRFRCQEAMCTIRPIEPLRCAIVSMKCGGIDAASQMSAQIDGVLKMTE